jgi:hypothetical protein
VLDAFVKGGIYMCGVKDWTGVDGDFDGDGRHLDCARFSSQKRFGGDDRHGLETLRVREVEIVGAETFIMICLPVNLSVTCLQRHDPPPSL